MSIKKVITQSVFAVSLFALGWFANLYLDGQERLRPVVGVVHPSSQGGILVDPNDPGQTTDFAQFWNTWAALDVYFAPARGTSTLPTSNDRVAAAIEGLAKSYGDPYTVFLPKKQADQLKETVRGDFEGIGAVLNQVEGVGILVSQVLAGSPAEKAGVTSGDVIIAVDTQSVLGEDFNEVVKHIRGAAGTDVTLTIERKTGVEDIVVTRGKVEIPTVASAVISRLEEVKDKIGSAVSAAFDTKDSVSSVNDTEGGDTETVDTDNTPAQKEERSYRAVRLVSFSGSSVAQFAKELKAYATSDEKAFILDLRGNPGGDLAVATDIASHFLEEGERVATVRDMNGNEEYYNSKGYGTLEHKDGCEVVIVDGNSASASEILAAALEEHDTVETIGDTTFGKGSVQSLVEVGDLGTLKVTIAHWYTPDDESISGVGYTPKFAPDTNVEATTGDVYMDTALAVCKGE